jgi:hypothetical protein
MNHKFIELSLPPAVTGIVAVMGGKRDEGSTKKAELNLSDAEREQLQAWTRRRKTSQALAPRSRIVLECAKGGRSQGRSRISLAAFCLKSPSFFTGLPGFKKTIFSGSQLRDGPDQRSGRLALAAS